MYILTGVFVPVSKTIHEQTTLNFVLKILCSLITQVTVIGTSNHIHSNFVLLSLININNSRGVFNEVQRHLSEKYIRM